MMRQRGVRGSASLAPVLLVLLAAPPLLQAQAHEPAAARTALDWLARHETDVIDLASAIWEHPETAHREHRTSSLLVDRLAAAGFQISRGVAGLPTAFVANYGTGHPIVGIVALLDALPGLSQARLAAERTPQEGSTDGHGCGHNLIAAADTGAALAIARAIDGHELTGTIRLIGAPAEEIYHGGVYMVRDGVFDDLDALLFWHPSSVTLAIGRSGLAMQSVRYVFTGVPSDATDAADAGKNALSALERMSRAVDELTAALDAPSIVNRVVRRGGDIPSVVPERAEAWYFVHAADLNAVAAIVARMDDAGRGAADGVGASLEIQRLSMASHWLINERLARLLHDRLAADGALEYTSDEIRLAGEMQRAFGRPVTGSMAADPLPLDVGGDPVPISDDTAEAGWVTPRGGFLVACFPPGLASHTWQWTALADSSLARKGMMRAARTLVRAAVELLTVPATLKAVRDEFAQQTAGRRYVSPLPHDAKPFRYLEDDR